MFVMSYHQQLFDFCKMDCKMGTEQSLNTVIELDN